MARKTPIFFGWLIVGLMVFSMMLIYGTRNSFSSFFPYILDTFHWDRGVTAIMLSLNLLVYGLTAPFAGALVDRWKPRAVAIIGIFVLGLATAACYFATQLWQYYILFGILVPFGTAFCGSPVFNAALLNWFQKRRGLAMGLGQVGGGLGMVYIMVVDWVNTHWGWHYSFFVMGGLIIVLLLPLYLVFYHGHPRDKKLTAYGAETAQLLDPKQTKAATPDWTLRRAFKTYQLWLLIFGDFCFWGIGNYLVLAHQIKFAEDAGFTSYEASSIFALFGFVSILGQLSSFISDIIGREKAATIAVVLSIVGMVALMSVHDTSDTWLLYVFAICAGFATGLFSPTIIISAADLYQGKNVGAISALVLTGVGLGGAVGPWLGGFIYDLNGSYTVAFSISAVAIAISCICLWIAAPRNAVAFRAKFAGKK
jgi:MFS family permease